MSDRIAPTPVAPVVPTTTAAVRLRPIGLLGTRIEGGFWADRRRLNREVTIPLGAAQLEAAGNLANFRVAAIDGGGRYATGLDDAGAAFPFLDSDVYKWLEAVGWELAARPDPALSALADPIIDLVAAAQREDGYLDTYFQVAHPGREFTDLRWGHELYTIGHLVQAAVAWQRGTGDDRLLRVAGRAVDRINAEMGPGRRELTDGHPEIEMALVELYRTTGEARHLELARTLLERRGRGLLGSDRFGARYWQDHEPVRSAPEPTGHAVRQVYLDCGVVDVAVETGDRELLGTAVRRWEAMVASRTYLTGGLGSRHRDEAFGDPFELPPDRAYAETCAAIGSVMLAWRLLLATGERRFADLIERTAYNAVLAGLALDGAHFFYSNPLQRRSGSAEVSEGAATTRRATWFACACCPPNLMRFLATVPDLVATTDEKGVQLHQLAAGSVEVPHHDGTVRFTVDTEYPWDADVAITIADTPPGPWTLSIRVPAWCESATAYLDGEEIPAGPGPDTLEISRGWRAGERVRLRLAMAPRITLPDPRIDAIRGTIALERGPLVYAVEEADLPPGVPLESIEVDASAPPATLMPSNESVLGGMTLLTLDAMVRDDPVPGSWPYRAASPEAAAESARAAGVRWTRIRAVPYFAWGNRSGLGMRAWLPARSTREPGSERAEGDATATGGAESQ